MFKITYKDLNNNLFTSAMEKVSGASGLPVKTAYTAGKIHEKVQQNISKAREAFAEIFKKHGIELKPGLDVPEDKKEALDKDLEVFMKTEVEIDQKQINLRDLEKVGLSGKEILALGSVLVNLDLVVDA